MPRGVPGPVVSRIKAKKRPRGKPFPKGHKSGGRPKGVRNKFTGELKAAILNGVHSANPKGLEAWITALAKDTPTSAAALLGRLIPVEQHHHGAVTLNVITGVPRPKDD